MTTPTQAQIEAAGVAYWNYYRQLDGNKPEASFQLDGDFAKAIAAALTAAAQVGEQRQEGMAMIAHETKLRTIERCAQVADDYSGDEGNILARAIATAIRKLKEEPKVDPNIIYPGKDPDFTFPEEEQ